MPLAVQRPRPDREAELFEVLPDEELRETFDAVFRSADEPDEAFVVDDPLEDLLLAEREGLRAEPLELLRLVDRDELLPVEVELPLPFDRDEALLPAFSDRPLPLDFLGGDSERFEVELRDDVFDPPPEDRAPLPILPASADCTTVAAPSTAPMAALATIVPAASAAFVNRPFDLRLLLADF